MTNTIKSILALTVFLLGSYTAKAQIQFKEKKYFNLQRSSLEAYCPSVSGGHIAGLYYVKCPRLCPTEKSHNSKYALTKLDENGSVAWTTCITKGTAKMQEIIPAEKKGEYYVAGYTNHTMDDGDYRRYIGAWLMKFNDRGDTLWRKRYGKTGYSHYGDALICTKDGGVVLIGHRYQHSKMQKGGLVDMDVFVYRIDKNGQILWKYFDDMGPLWESPKNGIETSNGDFLICGGSTIREGYSKKKGTAWLIRLNSKGKKLWSRHYGSGFTDFMGGIMESKEGGFIGVGRESHNSNIMANCGRRGLWIIKFNDRGRIKWQRFMDSKSPGLRSYAKYNSMVQLKDGSYLFGGVNLDVVRVGQPYLLRLSAQGKQLWDTTFSAERCEGVAKIHNLGNSNYRITGFLYSYEGSLSFDNWTVDFEDRTFEKPIDTRIVEDEKLVEIYEKPKRKKGDENSPIDLLVSGLGDQQPSFYPNPASDKISIDLKNRRKEVTIRIYNSRGKTVLNKSWQGKQEVELKVGQLKSSTYVLEIQYDGKIERYKLIKVNR